MNNKPHRSPLNTQAAAVYVGMQRNYLEKMRCLGGGPIFIKRGGLVLYDPDDLDQWLSAGRAANTSSAPRRTTVKTNKAKSSAYGTQGENPESQAIIKSLERIAKALEAIEVRLNLVSGTMAGVYGGHSFIRVSEIED